MKHYVFLFLIFLLFSNNASSGFSEPEDILKNLPSPKVRYPLPQISASAPQTLLQPQSSAEFESEVKKKLQQKQLEHSIKNTATKLERSLVNPVIETLTALATDSSDLKTTNRKTAAEEKKGLNNAATQVRVEKATRPEPVKLAEKTVTKSDRSRVPPPDAKKASAENKTLDIASKEIVAADKEEIVAVATEAATNDSTDQIEEEIDDLHEEDFEITDAEEEEKVPDGESEDGNQDEGPTDGDAIDSSTHDAVLAKATGLYKKKNWSEIKNLFSDNPEAGQTKQGLAYLIEAEINEKKPNYSTLRRNSTELAKLDRNSAIANYGLSQFYANSRKPNLAKALNHAGLALKAKRPPEGASAFYWKLTAKKNMMLIIIFFAGLIGGIIAIVKKKKAGLSTIDEAEPPEGIASDENDAQDTQEIDTDKKGIKKIIGKFSLFIKSLKTKFGKKKSKDSTDQIQDKGIKNAIETASEDEQISDDSNSSDIDSKGDNLPEETEDTEENDDEMVIEEIIEEVEELEDGEEYEEIIVEEIVEDDEKK